MTIQNALTTLSLLAVGFFLGATDLLTLQTTSAQPAAETKSEEQLVSVDLSNDAVRQLQGINEQLASAMETLRIEGAYTPATEGINPYLIMTGGGNAIDDLERGNGVDPFTFAALYSGKAVPDVASELSKDEHGRLLYKNNLVRIYSIERLKQREEMYQAILEKSLLPQ